MRGFELAGLGWAAKSVAVVCVVAVGFAPSGGEALGGMVSQTVNVPGRTLLAGVTSSAEADLEIAATFDTFDPALGTLSSIVVEHSFDFEIDVVPMGAGGAGSGAGGVSGLLKINDDLTFSGNGGGNGGTEVGIPYDVAGVDPLVPGTAAPSWIEAFTGGPGQTVKVAFDGEADARVVISPASVTHRLLDGSFWKVTYLFEAAGLPGDFNGSGSVEQGDLNLVLNNWGQTRPFEANGDPFVTAVVDQEELNRVLNNWGASSGAFSGAASPRFAGFEVPEPGAVAVLVAIGGCCVSRFRGQCVA